ncbi:hypothetical protein ACKESD_16465 [Acinetobacter baumannii]|jgi:hypothetical protein|uniref:Uncharacterized protein n=1 Tax=Acinetobacter pittii TaxID=48296 RepID=A0AB33BN03_ACIPI|nr:MULTISPECIES: hypothetical protein [Acinetobacter]AMX19823.1 hypothetical protein IEC338SC_2697 [Acinetobacter pittii]EHU1703114.1 hypothetical protein [Acinetobacter baumannii]EHU2111210.1 hypothetical protein [Acinetobacter baumannii]EHU3345956.1 hypothetical protein [Acinetobacter baumannii]EIY0851727.1 hypothetical protein [Acinetobacter baumannii]
MSFRYSSSARTLIVFGNLMNHYYDNVNPSQIDSLVDEAKFKEATWRK